MPMQPSITGDLNTNNTISVTVDKIKGISIPTLSDGILTNTNGTFSFSPVGIQTYYSFAYCLDLTTIKYSIWYTGTYTIESDAASRFNANGVYTVPSNGIYACSVHIRESNSTRFVYGLVKNGVVIREIIDYTGNNLTDLSAEYCIQANAGDTLEIVRGQPSGDPYQLQVSFYRLAAL